MLNQLKKQAHEDLLRAFKKKGKVLDPSFTVVENLLDKYIEVSAKEERNRIFNIINNQKAETIEGSQELDRLYVDLKEFYEKSK